MEQESPILSHFERARERAKRRKSPWNLILIALIFVGGLFIWDAYFQLMWRVHTWFYPDHAGGAFWTEGIRFPAFVSSFLLFMPGGFAAIPLSAIFANVVAWCIPPARRTFDLEAKGVKGTSFSEATKGLAKIALVMVPVCLALSFIGALTLVNLK